MVIKVKKYPLKKILLLLLTCLSAVALIKAYRVSPVETITRLEQDILSKDSWEEKQTAEGQEANYMEYSCRVPENMGENLVLAVSGYHSQVKVFMEGKELYSYEDPYREKGICWCFTELPGTALGQVLTLQISGYGSNPTRNVDPAVYLGEHNAVFIKILKENVLGPFLGTAVVLAGIVVCVISILMRRRVDVSVRKGLSALGYFISITGIWMITDSRLLQFVTGRVALITLVSFLTFMLMPYFLLVFIAKMMIYRKKSVVLLSRLYLLNMAICLFLYLFRILPLFKTLIGVHVLLLVSIGIVMKNVVLEIHNFKNKEMKKIALGLILLVVLGITALVCFYINPSSDYSVLYGMGIVLFIVCLLGAAVDRLRYYFITSASAEEYQEIAHTDTMTHMGNRMAFTKQQADKNWQENKSCIVLDINNLKATNDKYGHGEGDRLIIDAAECIQTAFGAIGKCYRVGGDEFAVLMSTSSEEEILSGIEKMKQQAELKNNSRKIPVEMAYGYAIRQKTTTAFEDLFNEADAKMYARKQKMKEDKAKRKE